MSEKDMMPRWLQAEESTSLPRRCANNTRCPHARVRRKNESAPTMARTLFERCITSYITALHFRCRTEASDNRCRDAARPSRGRGSFWGGGTPPRKIFFVLFLLQKKERSNRNSESCRRPTAAREKTTGAKKTPRLRRKGETNKRYDVTIASRRIDLTPSPLREQCTLSPCARAMKKQVCTHNGSDTI